MAAIAIGKLRLAAQDGAFEMVSCDFTDAMSSSRLWSEKRLQPSSPAAIATCASVAIGSLLLRGPIAGLEFQTQCVILYLGTWIGTMMMTALASIFILGMMWRN